MKCIIVITIMILPFFFSGAVLGQKKTNAVIDSFGIEMHGDTLMLNFKVAAGRKDVFSDHKLFITPVIRNGKDSVLLKPVIVRNRKTAIMDNRNGFEFGNEVFWVDNGQQIDYVCAVSYQDWMDGAEVYTEQLSSGCGKDRRLPNIRLTDRLLINRKDVKPSDLQQRNDSLDILNLPRIERVVERWVFSYNELIIDFEKNSAVIDPAFENNRQMLEEVVAAIDSVKANPYTTINKIEITGYASPEGAVANNIWLGESRAKALKNYLQRKFPYLNDTDFQLKNGGENWDRLRKLVVDSDMEFKKDVLYIIDNVPAKIDIKNNTSRKKQLMDLKGGRPYNYMYKVFFPKLRNACYVVIYYNIPAAEASAGTLNQNKQAE